MITTILLFIGMLYLMFVAVDVLGHYASITARWIINWRAPVFKLVRT